MDARVKLLQGEKGVRKAMLEILVEFPERNSEIIAAIGHLLREGDNQERFLAARALGATKTSDAAEILVQALASEENEMVKREIVRALGKCTQYVKRKEFMDALYAAMEDPATQEIATEEVRKTLAVWR